MLTIINLHIGKPINIDNTLKILNNITGVLEVGLFINMCDRIIAGTDDNVKVIEKK